MKNAQTQEAAMCPLSNTAHSAFQPTYRKSFATELTGWLPKNTKNKKTTLSNKFMHRKMLQKEKKKKKKKKGADRREKGCFFL